jgi:maleate isomerase
MYGWRRQIGFVTPSNNTVIEPEYHHITPEGVSVHFTKVYPRKPVTDGTNLDDDGEAMEAIARSKVDVIGYACMATSLVGAEEWERKAVERTGVPTVTATSAVKEALRLVGAKKVAMVCHYPPEKHTLVRESFKSDGFEVVSIETADVPDQKEVNFISTDTVYKMAQKADRPEADAICLLATDLRTFPILQKLEDDLGKPVIGTNQALFWKTLQMANIKDKIEGYGSLLSGELLRVGVH